MAYFHSPRTVTDGLVFYYDLANQLKSYKGEPTTNVLNNNILGTGNGAFLSSDSVGTYIQLANLTSSYSRFQLPSIPVSSNDTYTWSFELMSPETITTNYYFDTNEYSDQFPTSNDLSRASATHRVPSTMPAGVWQEFSLTVTMKPDLTGAYTYDFFNMLYPTFQNKKIYYRNMQFEFKDHPTQYAGQGATRSATEGLLDLTGNKTINISTMSFGSNAEMYFDGTDDRIDMSLYHLSGSSHTEELVVYRAVSDTTHGLVSDLQYGFFGIYMHSSNKVYYRQMQQNPGQTPEYPSVTISSTNTFGVGYHHIVGVYSNSFGFRLYVNGNLEASNSTVLPFNLAGGRGINHLGVYKDTNAATYGYPLNGRIELFKAYNRALSPEEVAQNFNAVRARYAI